MEYCEKIGMVYDIINALVKEHLRWGDEKVK